MAAVLKDNDVPASLAKRRQVLAKIAADKGKKRQAFAAALMVCYLLTL
jgi:hypothetical protein